MPKKQPRRSNWKIHQRIYKIKKKTKLALFSLAILLALLVLSQIIRFVNLLTHPLNSSIMGKNYTWNGEFNLNFVVGSKPISLVSFQSQERKIIIMSIPDETYIDVPGGFGKWQVRSIYELGGGSKVGGEKLLKQSISDFLGISVDAFSSENLADVFKENLFSGITHLPNLNTDLTLWELIKLKVGMLQVRFDKIKRIDLSKVLVLEKDKLADGTEIFIADPIRLDSITGEFADPKIVAEHSSVAIFNATDRPLLARKAKRIITNLGGNVIVTQNAPFKVSKSYVEGEKSKTLDRLTQIFDLGCQVDPNCDKIPREDLGLGSLRAQIIVVLGEDF